jgi:hypothetical protein
MMTHNLELDLLAELEEITTIDAHEHLPPEETRLKEPRDFYSLFEHYCADDLMSCGATPADMTVFADRTVPLATRWARFRPFLSKIRTGGYTRSVLIINSVQARSALSEWLEMVPNNKIFGFGGDYSIVEKVYGHLTLARQNIAAVLAEKITMGAMSRSEAVVIARRLLFENPREFYGLPV